MRLESLHPAGHSAAGVVARGGVSDGVPWIASRQATGRQQGLHALQLPRRIQLPWLPRDLPLSHVAQLTCQFKRCAKIRRRTHLGDVLIYVKGSVKRSACLGALLWPAMQCLKCNMQAGCCSLGLPSLAMSSDSEPQRRWRRPAVLFRSGVSQALLSRQKGLEKKNAARETACQKHNFGWEWGSQIIRQSADRNTQGLRVCTLGILADLTMVVGSVALYTTTCCMHHLSWWDSGCLVEQCPQARNENCRCHRQNSGSMPNAISNFGCCEHSIAWCVGNSVGRSVKSMCRF